MASPRSSTLFHFTKSRETIQSILQKGFIPYYNLEDTSWLGAKKVPFQAFPRVCFCDIPIGRIKDHVRFYGAYGIGMSKEWALKKGINPVAYYPSVSSLSNMFLDAIRAAINAKKKDIDSKLQDCLFTFLSYAKPIDGTMIVAGSPVNKEFYLENEWRHVPPNTDEIPHPISRNYYDDEAKRNALNTRAETASVTFTPSDVRYIFVKADADIPPLINFINDKLQHHSAFDLKILTSRITSLEYLQKDI